MKSLSTNLVLGTLAFLIAFLLVRESNPIPPNTENQNIRPRAKKSLSRPKDPSPQLIARIPNTVGNFRNSTLETIDLVYSIPVAEIELWIDQALFTQREGFSHTLFRKLIEERWRSEDPDGYAFWVLKNGDGIDPSGSGESNLAAVPILAKWAIEDPSRYKQAMSEVSISDKMTLESNTLNEIAQNDPTAALKILSNRKSGILPYTIHYTALNQISSSIPEQEVDFDKIPNGIANKLRQSYLNQKNNADQ